jgi:hypothetical protein
VLLLKRLVLPFLVVVAADVVLVNHAGTTSREVLATV